MRPSWIVAQNVGKVPVPVQVNPGRFISTTQLAWVRIPSRMALESSVLGWASHPSSKIPCSLDLQAIWDGLVMQRFLWAWMAKCSKDGMDFDLVQHFLDTDRSQEPSKLTFPNFPTICKRDCKPKSCHQTGLRHMLCDTHRLCAVCFFLYTAAHESPDLFCSRPLCHRGRRQRGGDLFARKALGRAKGRPCCGDVPLGERRWSLYRGQVSGIQEGCRCP